MAWDYYRYNVIAASIGGYSPVDFNFEHNCSN